MSHTFREQIERSLGSENLQAALDANAERRGKARKEAYASLPEDWSVLRRRAHAVRAGVIDHLDEFLARFIAQVEANGVIVHQAADAAQACALVLEIARQHQVRLVAKSKTMVGEEIDINAALEAAGLQVVETDLGEYIVQLRSERPAHIITPAVHLRRAEVGQTFQEKLGIPYTEDIPTLTNVARRVLRRTFLEADMGISGVNFGVVENGALCIVTNEGNGRMVTHLPRVHVALMGIERLAPSMDDLALLLSLLPRSATGQKLSVYTNLLRTPRHAGEAEGPQERHLILLDNGRRALRSSSLRESLLCIRCGACLNACPVFRELGGHAYVGRSGKGTPYPGPIGSVISPGLFGEGEFGQLARASTLCGACKEACPVDIDLPKLLLRVRAGGKDLPASGGQLPSGNPPNVPPALRWGLRLFAWASASAGRFHLAQRLAGLLSRPLARRGWMPLPASTGWGVSRDIPSPSQGTFRQRWQQIQGEQLPTPPPVVRQEPIPAESPQEPDLPELPLEKRFRHEMETLGGKVIDCRVSDLPKTIAGLVRQHGGGPVIAWEASRLPAGILEGLQKDGLEIQHHFDAEAELKTGQAVPVGLTGALAGIAETGSLVLACGPESPASASLVVGTHIALLARSALLPGLAQALGLPELQVASSAVLISGPSRTADIEMTLTIGVHGPKEVIVLLYEDRHP